jgi:putative addiction module component (TIGR02574 family)
MKLMTIEELQVEVLKLDERARATLATRLLQSLDGSTEELSEQQWTEAWTAEADRRNAEMDADPSLGIPADKVFPRIRQRLR